MSVKNEQKAQEFLELKDVDGKVYSSQDFKEKILVIIFSCNHCPYVKAYEERYVKIQSEFESKGVRLIVINSNDSKKYPEDGYDLMVQRSNEKGYNFKYLHDETQVVAKSFGATNTPHVFVLDENRILQYTGRIDDNWEDESKVESHDLRNVLNDLLEGKQPRLDSTLPVGCSIKWK